MYTIGLNHFWKLSKGRSTLRSYLQLYARSYMYLYIPTPIPILSHASLQPERSTLGEPPNQDEPVVLSSWVYRHISRGSTRVWTFVGLDSQIYREAVAFYPDQPPATK